MRRVSLCALCQGAGTTWSCICCCSCGFCFIAFGFCHRWTWRHCPACCWISSPEHSLSTATPPLIALYEGTESVYIAWQKGFLRLICFECGLYVVMSSTEEDGSTTGGIGGHQIRMKGKTALVMNYSFLIGSLWNKCLFPLSISSMFIFNLI